MTVVREMPALEAWSVLERSAAAQLIDVRTRAEWSFVGVPDLRALGKDAILIEWQEFPSMQRNAGFEDELIARLKERNVDWDTPLIFLCRSGARSMAAARAMSGRGYNECINLAHGFEGDLNTERHRGRVSGWKAQCLPWCQS